VRQNKVAHFDIIHMDLVQRVVVGRQTSASRYSRRSLKISVAAMLVLAQRWQWREHMGMIGKQESADQYSRSSLRAANCNRLATEREHQSQMLLPKK